MGGACCKDKDERGLAAKGPKPGKKPDEFGLSMGV